MELEPFTLVAGKWFLIYTCVVGIFSAAECIISKRPKPTFLNKRKVVVASGAFCATLLLFTLSKADQASVHYMRSAAGSIINLDDCPHQDEGDVCLNGGHCVDGDQSWSCACPDGFTGTHCEITIAKYEGCFQDKIEDRDLGENLKSARGAMTNAMCWENCKGFKYAATQFHNECWCGNSFSKHGKLNEGDCNLLCDGNKEEICGGKLKNSVYHIGNTKK